MGERLQATCVSLANELTERHFRRRPELDARFGRAGRRKCAEDAAFHISYLAQAVALGVPELFADYTAWARPMLASQRIPLDDLIADMKELQALLAEHFPQERASIDAAIAPALAAVGAAADQVPLAPLAPQAERYFNAALADPIEAQRVADELATAGMALKEIYVNVLQPAMHRAGELWQANRLTVAEEHYFTAVTQRVMAALYSAEQRAARRGPAIVVACVADELHELGARMVSDLLALEGYRSHYLGASMPPRAIVDFACIKGARVLAISASIAPHLAPVRETIELVRADPRGAAMKVLVGGGPFSRIPQLWRAVGADASAPDAASALTEVARLVA